MAVVRVVLTLKYPMAQYPRPYVSGWEDITMTGNNAITKKTIYIENVSLDDYLKATELKNKHGCKTWHEYLLLSNRIMEEAL